MRLGDTGHFADSLVSRELSQYQELQKRCYQATRIETGPRCSKPKIGASVDLEELSKQHEVARIAKVQTLLVGREVQRQQMVRWDGQAAR